MLTFSDSLHQVATDPTFAVTAMLTLAVILVNGWTDAPNAIATCVATGAIGINAAIGRMRMRHPSRFALHSLQSFPGVLGHGGLASQRVRAMRSSRGSQVLPWHLPGDSHA